LILEILLLQGADNSVKAGTRANGGEEALQVLMDWETWGKQAGVFLSFPSALPA
jgi:hypothetical protein